MVKSFQRKTFIRGGEQTVSYSYTDIAEGTGTVSFYGFMARDATNNKYYMSRNQLTSEEHETSVSYSNGAVASLIDDSFTLSEYKIPQTVEGTAYFQIPLYTSHTTSPGAATFSTTITLEDYDGSTATTIATVTLADYNLSNTIGTSHVQEGILEVPRYKIDVGHNLRVKLTITVQRTIVSTETAAIGHSPTNQDGNNITVADAGTTQLIFNIPFKLDI